MVIKYSGPQFLKIALPAVALPALVVLLLPARAWPTYVDIVEPLSLFIGSLLSLYAAFMYRKELKAAFIFLAAFLFIHMLAIILFLSYSPILPPYLERYIEETEIFRLVQTTQLVNYAMLFLFCLNLLKVVHVTELNRNGWILFTMTVIFSLSAALYPVLDLIKDVSNLGLVAIYRIAIRLFDAGLIIVLMPVLWLYVQYLKSQQRQSLTFTIIIFGIVCSVIFDYLFQLVLTVFPQLLTQGSRLETVIPEMLFIYGYLVISVGLYAHRKQDKWGYEVIDRTMAGELELADLE